MRRVQRRKKPVDYLLPFLVLISIGVIGILGFQLWSTWDAQSRADAYFYVAEGKAKVLPFAQTDWDNAFSGTKLLLGDSLKTSTAGLVVMEFFNGTMIRMAENSSVSLVDLSKASDKETIVVSLDNGKVWVKGQKSAGVREAEYEVRTRHLLVKAVGTVFEVESGKSDTVRVMDGSVEVDVYIPVGESERVAETISVGVGQEITIDDAALKVFSDNGKPSVLMAISDEFKSSKWYAWNNKEDLNPTDFAVGGSTMSEMEDLSATPDSEEELTGGNEVELSDEKIDEEDDSANNGVIGQPVIKQPTSLTTDTGKFEISGTVSEGTAKVIVENSANGDRYVLSAFKEGDTDWSYNVSTAYGNIKAGDTTYKVYAVTADGNESDPAKIVITYEKGTTEIIDKLTAPKVLSFNGASSNEVATGVVKVVGKVEGAEKVVVSGYELSQFQPGDTSWTYYANEDGGNLKEGTNEYQVYAVDPDGNKSAVTDFSIIYTKSASNEEASSVDDVSDSSSAESTYGF